MTDWRPGSTAHHPWLSVVVPTFNGARLIRRALDSVAAADEAGLECVVVDDGSTDDTLAIVRSYKDILRLRVVPGPAAGNWVSSTNTGVRAATGEFVTFLHQDDEWLPGRMDAIKEVVGWSAGSVLFVHAARFLSASGRDLGHWTMPLPGRRGVAEGSDFVERLLVQNFLCIGAAVFRRRQFLSIGGMDEDLWYTADWDLWLRLASTGTVAYDPRPLVGFRIHAASQTATRSVDASAFRRQMEGVFDTHFARWSVGAGRAGGAVERAARASIELNVALAAVSHRSLPPLGALLGAVAALGPGGARRVARDSRLHQRVGARIRAGAWRDDRGPRMPAPSSR